MGFRCFLDLHGVPLGAPVMGFLGKSLVMGFQRPIACARRYHLPSKVSHSLACGRYTFQITGRRDSSLLASMGRFSFHGPILMKGSILRVRLVPSLGNSAFMG